MAVIGRYKTRAEIEREEEEKKRKASEERFVLPTYEELNAIEEKAKEDAARVASSEKGLDLFKKPSNWDDGYQFGDVTKTALGTLGDIGVGAVKGVMKLGEGIGDAAQYGAAAVTDLFGADETAERIRQNAQREKVAEVFSGVDKKLDKYSVLGRTSDAAAESLGQIGGILATGGIAGALGAGGVGATAATTGVMGLSSFGSGTGEAYAAGADEGEAEAYGAIAGAADALSEMIFGGLGKGFKALGLSKGITSADDALAKAVTSKIRNTLAKNTVQLGIKAGAEGLEEVLAGTMQAAGKKSTYMSERDFADIIKDENLLEQFVVGAMASGISQTPSFFSATRAGVDLVSDGTAPESDSAQGAQDKFAALRDKNADFGEIERTGLASGAKDEDIRMAGELSSTLGKKIRFFREEAKNGTINNGEYHEDTGEIWINTRSKNVKAQIVAHELTHSIEKKDGYRQLVNMAMNKLEAEQKAKGKTLDDLYREKETLYADGGVRLASYDEITSELVAEYVEKRLLTDEASIKSLVSENRTLGQRIREWFDSLLAKMGNASAKEREYIRQMRDVYARALGETTSTSGDGEQHSIKRTKNVTYEKQINELENGRFGRSDSLYIGAPSDALKSAGFSANPFAMNQSDYRKSRRAAGNNKSNSAHNVPKDFFDDMPKYLADASMIIDNGDRATIVTSYPMADTRGNPSFVVAGVWKDNSMESDTVNQVKSVYPRDGLAEYLRRSEEEGKLVILDKEKADSIFAAVGKQYSEGQGAIDFSQNSISQNGGNVKGENAGNGQHSLTRVTADSEGRPLSDAQKEYFKGSKVVDENGNLKVMYHGTQGGEFTVFDKKKAKSSGTFGRGFYFSDSKSHAGQYGNTFEVYLNIKNPLQGGTKTMTEDQIRSFVEAVAENEDYGLDNYGYEATVDSVVNSLYGKSDFEIMMDVNLTCIGNMAEALELFNEVNGTAYDGIITPMETVVFDPAQIKNVNNQNPTSNPDIRYSVSKDDSDKRVMPKKSAAGTKARARQEQQKRLENQKYVDWWSKSLALRDEKEKANERLKRQQYGAWWQKELALQDEREKTERRLQKEHLESEQKSFDENQKAGKRIEDEQYKAWWQKALSDEDRKRELESRRDNMRESKELHDRFEQERRERKERGKKEAEEARREEIESGEIRTVAQRLDVNLENAQAELDDLWTMRENTAEEYRSDLALMQGIYQSQKNKNTEKANALERRIARIEARAKDEDAAYQKRIADVETRIEKIRSEIHRGDSAKERNEMRKDVHESIIADIKNNFSKRGLDLDVALAKAKDLSTFSTVDNTPQRVMEKSLGYKAGQVLSDLTVNQTAKNETEGIRWLNQFTDRQNGVLAELSKKYNIKPGSKESAAAQMYAEGFYVDKHKEIVEYGDRELAADFPDAQVQKNIKGLANDPIIRQIYDQTLDAINESRVRNAYPEIQKLDNYYLHFRAMDDTFSKLGIPFNPNDIRAKDLPTDINGVTADLKPGQPYFASAQHRQGKRTSFDLLGGLEKYLTSAKNQIYHIDDIQTLRALRNYIADMYGQAHGLEGLDSLDEDAAQERIKEVYDAHLSTFAKFLNEEANIIAGKTSLIDRGLEGMIGRRGITFLNDINRQVGANMVGWNVSSSLTNFLAPVQALAKTNKLAFIKGFAQTVENRMKSITGNGDDFAQKSDVMVRRKGADRFHRTAWQKMSDPGYLLMGMVDDISTEIIARAKYNELTAKGMDAETANRETDKWVSRLMGDRSLGQMPQIFNSKMLGMVTKFQLEVRNQLDSQFYDTIKEAQADYAEIGDKIKRNAKVAAKVTATIAELALAQHVFGQVFESIAGYNPAFDIIEVIATVLGLDDDEESEDTVLDNIEQGVLALIEDMPYSSVIMDGGRIPMSSALPISELVTGEDQYGNGDDRYGGAIQRAKTLAGAVPYYVLPGGYGQIKKTAQGLAMFGGDKPVTGSYTDSGNLRFPVEATPGNVAQAAVFGQWANENARDYFDNERSPISERQAQGYAESGLEWRDYQKYKAQITKLQKDADKVSAIKELDISATAKEALYRSLVASAVKDEDGNIIGSSEDDRISALYGAGLGFEDFLDIKAEQSALNADKALSAGQRATRFYAWTARMGYTDEQRDIITDQFTFASGFKVQPQTYEKLVAAGVTDDNAVKVTDALSGTNRTIDKINAIWSTGLTGAQLDSAVKAVVTEKWYDRYRAVIDANVPLDVLTWVLDNADTDDNDSISNEERTLILSQLAMSRKELSALWIASGGSAKSDPWGTGSGNAAGGIKMPEVKMPKIEMPKIDFSVPHFGFEIGG